MSFISQYSKSPSFRMCVRIMVMICLVITAVTVGVGSYLILSRLQDKAQQGQYYAITRKIESSTMSAILDKQDALNTGLTLALEYCPNESDWPQCGISFSFYQAILNPLNRISQTRTLNTAIVIKPSEVASFENFTYQFYADRGHPEIGLSSFGKGIFALNTTTGKRYHDTTGKSGGGKHDYLMPVVQVTDFPNNKGVLMYNIYSEINRVQAIDYSIDCVENQNKSATDCTSITGFIRLLQDKTFRPASFTILPIVLKSNSTQKNRVVGTVFAVFNWDTVLNLAVNEKVDGIMAVLSDGASYHSFIYEDGQVYLKGSGDVHDSKYDDQRVTFTATPYGGPTYTVSLYPTKEWMDHYNDEVPLIASLVMVGLILFTSLVFYLYDYLMNREAVHKDLVMQTKRQYVRYISHEIRTPLNVVHLGFQVLFTEMKKMRESVLGVSDNTGVDPENPETTTHDAKDALQSNSSAAIAPPEIIPLLRSQTGDWIDLVHDIVESLNAGIAVLNDLIDYDKIESGTMNLQKESLSIWDFTNRSVRPFIVQAQAKNIDLFIDMHERSADRSIENKKELESLVVLGDRVKLSQVFRNLVSNALKFTPAGGNVRVEGRWEKLDRSDIKMEHPSVRPHNEPATRPKPTDVSRFVLLSTLSGRSPRVAEPEMDPLEAQYESAGRVVITVSDSGAGMSVEQVKQLFREGVQFNPNDLQAGQGSGLGLWITKGIVDSHGGKLWAASEGEGQGTTFTLSLPVFRLSAPQISEEDMLSKMEEGVLIQSEEIDGTCKESVNDSQYFPLKEKDVEEIHQIELTLDPKETRRFHNLLVTDDSAVNRKMMCRSLQSVGFKCFQAADGQECVDIVDKAMRNEHESIDLVLMDYEMPRMNGPTACAALRAMGCAIPVVGVTGNVLNEDKQLFMEHGAVRVLQKPFSVTDLDDALDQIQSHRKNVRQTIDG